MKRCILIIFLLLASKTCLADIQDTVKKEIISEFQDKEFTLRPILNNSPFVYLYIDSTEVYYEYDNLRFFKKNSKASIVVEKIDFEDRHEKIEVKLKTDKGDSGELKLYLSNLNLGNFTLEKFKSIINKALYITAEESKGFIVNKNSGLIHVSGCNHLPEEVNREEYLSREDALSKGYKLCPICFIEYPDIPGYFAEKEMGDRCAAMQMAQYSVYYDDESQEVIQNAGKKVLDNWPLPLKGYRYKFVMLDDEQTNACACPGGRIFIFKGLMDNIESEEELEMVLAHEIAHVELRHAYAGYLEALSAKQGLEALSTFTAIAAGAAASDDQKTAAIVLGTISLVATIASDLVFLGYERKYEYRADLYSLMYLDTKYKEKDRRKYVSILKKLKYQIDCLGKEGAELFSDHPDMTNRIKAMLEGKYAFFKLNNRFYAVDNEGNKIAELFLIAQNLYAEKSTLEFILSYFPEKPTSFFLTDKDILKIYIGDKCLHFLSPVSYYTVNHNEDKSLSYKMIWEKQMIDAPIDKIEFRIGPPGSTVQWIKAE